MNTIPNIQIQNIGSSKKPLQVIKGFIELPCWTGFFLIEEPDYLIKTKVVTNGRIDLWVDGEIGLDHSFSTNQEQGNAYVFLVEQQQEIQRAIIQELKEEFPRLLADEYASWDHENGDFPKSADLTPGFDFKDYIGPYPSA
ncbi:hypothetical protein GWR56_13915 [Mucilaginibacter sp. 14171R-50]|uniref:hypothetical protein n=1 Tax=Mucilaginibacter sp. 14171R-50 TaxID=2703789 RepID=UPI00138D0206|nr:hypothetical protein [Mucilaginibacter sp. 14171R-50]QHS56586.1 hypothetical protein GWR56_13915 [Mucilaginibacter sp. 14171R-50]